jgi:hypothetical protein
MKPSNVERLILAMNERISMPNQIPRTRHGSGIAAKKQKLLQFSHKTSGWYVGYNSKCVETKLFLAVDRLEVDELKKTYENFIQGNYEKIFPTFNHDLHSVNYGSSEGLHIFNLNEIDESMSGDTLPNGVYKFDIVDGDYYIFRLPAMSSDKKVDLTNSIQNIESDISKFLDNKHIYESLGMRYRRGALIYGPPGCGKTFSIIKSVENVIDKKDCIVFILTENLHGIDFLVDFLPVFMNRNIIFIVEELTEKLKTDTESYLSFLDGEMSWDCSYTIATTNYPEELEKNIVDRPGRFDLMLEVGLPDENDRRKYLDTVLKTTVTDDVIKMTDGMSIAYLKEICLQHKITEDSLEIVIKRMQDRKDSIKRDFKEKKRSLGFKSDEDDFE